MCGIVGGTSERNILPILVEGLRRLEYRGYDSAGIAFKKNGSISVVKNLGRVEQLAKKINLKNNSTNLGIAHTSGLLMACRQRRMLTLTTAKIFMLFTMASLKTTKT